MPFLMPSLRRFFFLNACLGLLSSVALTAEGAESIKPAIQPFLEAHCTGCHDAETKKGNLDLTALRDQFTEAENFSRWVKIHDRIESGEMPPKKKARPPVADVAAVKAVLSRALLQAEATKQVGGGRTTLHRMTRSEYENTVRDLFALPGIAVRAGLPADGSAHGFDNNSDALDISHVNLARYIDAADTVLNMAIATRPVAPATSLVRLSLARNYEPDIMLMQGDAMLFRDKKPDPVFPPAGEYAHVDQGAHEQIGIFDRMSSVGVFRHEDDSWNPYFRHFASLYPGRYRIRASFWSLTWDKGEVRPARGVEAARLSVVQFNENGRGGQHPSYVLGYFAAPSLESKVHEMNVWFNEKETIGFNPASLAPIRLYRIGNYGPKGRIMGYTGPCVVSDWVDIEGPFNDVWPPRSHQLLFGSLPISEIKPDPKAAQRPPVRVPLRQDIIGCRNRPETEKGVWSVTSAHPMADADKLLADFLPKAFRRPVTAETRAQYLAQFDLRVKAGDCFETAMRWVYRAALCSPDFLYHVEAPGKLDDYALASRLSYFLWNSQPDELLAGLITSGQIRDPKVLDQQIERMLSDPKSDRFVEDFLGQWLKLRSIGVNDPDKKLYPEFNPYLQDSMVSETRAYFRELLERNLDASFLVRSDFAMLNERLAVHYGITGVSGPEIRKVTLPAGCVRGGFLTQAALLKVTANGTTTSPVVRGSFVMARLLGRPPEPPPANVPAVEPDVQGTTTIREQLAKHRADPACASCHTKIDPAGFALESFDVIGGQRGRYRSIGEGDVPPRGSIDPRIKIDFKLGPKVDASGELPDGRKFADILQLKDILANERQLLLRNLAEQLTVYSTGHALSFGDRTALAEIVARTEAQGGGMRTLIHELVRSPLFQTR